MGISQQVDRIVREEWKVNPGISNKLLLERVQARVVHGEENGDGIITTTTTDINLLKAYIKAAKMGILYSYREPAEEPEQGGGSATTNPDNKRIEFVQQKLQERQSLREERRFKESDQIAAGLEAMGIAIDDRYKQWTFTNTTNNSKEEINQTKKIAVTTTVTGVACESCGRIFASRNLVFAHLRNPVTSCGNAIFASNQNVPLPPSYTKKTQKLNEQVKRRRRTTGTTAVHADYALWVGDIPLEWTACKGQMKYLGLLLRHYLPSEVPQPWIQRVHRKAYKIKLQEVDNGGQQHPKSNYFLGYAIVVFRDEEEMELVLKNLNGITVSPTDVFSNHHQQEVIEAAEPATTLTASDDKEAGFINNLPSFTLRVKPATTTTTAKHKDTTSSTASNGVKISQKQPQQPGVDPPMIDQLRPLTTQELFQRMESLGHSYYGPVDGGNRSQKDEVDVEDDNDEEEHDSILKWAADIYNNQLVPPRPVLHHQGRPIPLEIQTELLTILQSLRWAVPNSRTGLTAERYLVLYTKSNTETDRHYGHLRKACQRLMEWADPQYYYSGIAVTHNFVASPHIDDRDQSFQYAVSLGDFGDDGGELCVDGFDRNEGGGLGKPVLHVVNTRNRIAKVDGRHVHWVRTWTGGDRYSLIFYDTTDRNPTPILETGIDDAWCSDGYYEGKQ